MRWDSSSKTGLVVFFSLLFGLLHFSPFPGMSDSDDENHGDRPRKKAKPLSEDERAILQIEDAIQKIDLSIRNNLAWVRTRLEQFPPGHPDRLAIEDELKQIVNPDRCYLEDFITTEAS